MAPQHSTESLATYNSVQVRVVEGDVTRIPCDALITAINSYKEWFGGIDRVIQATAGTHFHNQAETAELIDGAAIIAVGKGSPSPTQFKNVVFVVDDLQRELREIILAGLKAANAAGFKQVALPAIRMGVMLGIVEKSVEEAVLEIATGIKSFIDSTPNPTLTDITFVVFRDANAARHLGETIKYSLN